MKELAEELLVNAGVKVTPNRLLVADALINASRPLSLIELETELETLERSSVLRVLSVLLERGVLHTMEDGKGISKYELHKGSGECSINDMHIHFYCEMCERTYCLEDNPIPDINIPGDFEILSANFMFKGICPSCKSNR